MQVDTTRLSLFGLDLAPLLSGWRLGWRELLWGDALGVRRRLDDAIELREVDGQRRLFVGSEPVPEGSARRISYQALLMPSESTLCMQLRTPRALEAELADVVQLEATASSPFLPEDTCFGWRVVERVQDELLVAVVIAARTDVLAFLREQEIQTANTAELPEVWCGTQVQGGTYVVLGGFGEQRRSAEYSRRLRWLGICTVLSSLCFAAIMMMPALARQIQADRMSSSLNEIQREAAPALEARESLMLSNERSEALRALVEQRPDYFEVLNELSAFTPDSVYFEEIELEGAEVEVQGWARNAAGFIQKLAESPRYSDVRSLSGIRRHGRTQLEQFRVRMNVAVDDAPENGEE